MEYQQIKVDKANKVAVCRFVNPPLNLMTMTMTAELDQFIGDVESDDSVRAVVFTGGLPDVFIWHYDVGELSLLASMGMPPEMPKAADLPGHKLQARMEALPKVTIAAINGQCGGGGCEFALACDIRIMAIGDFGIGLPEAGVGILPGGGGTQRLPRVIGEGRALEIMLLGKTVGAEEAERIGLVSKAVPKSDLLPTALNLALRLAHGANVSQGLIKKLVYRGSEVPLEQGIQMEWEAFLATLATEDAQSGMKAYLQGNLWEHKGR